MSPTPRLQEAPPRAGQVGDALAGPHFATPGPPAPAVETAPETVPARPRGPAWPYATALAGVGTLGVAWHVPGTPLGAALGWLATPLILATLRAERSAWPLYAGGLLGHAIAFHWVYETVAVAGNLGAAAGGLIFAAFVATAAFQFAAIGLIHARLGPAFDALALRGASAVVLAEFLVPRLFRWHLGHTQLGLTPMAQAAGLGGALLVTFVMAWVSEAVVEAAARRRLRPALVLPVVGLGLALAYGFAAVRQYGAPTGPSARVVLVQGDADLVERRDLDAAMENTGVLYDLTGRTPHRGALVVWPEGSIPAFVPSAPGRVEARPALPWFGPGTALLVGAYAADESDRRYNAAFAVDASGDVPAPYFKRVLIPFGEAMPLAGTFPALARLNPRAGRFVAGDAPRVFEYSWPGLPGGLKVAPLICYEDTMPALAAEAARAGGEVLVNLTSDAWFARSIASRQHHAIASFRAIETRRYLVRATTTGLSGVVDPLGRTVASIAPFRPGVVSADVYPLRDRSPYAATLGDLPWWGLLALGAGGAGLRRLQRA